MRMKKKKRQQGKSMQEKGKFENAFLKQLTEGAHLN